MQSKFVNDVCRLLQLLGDFPRSATGALPLDLVGFSPQMKIPSAATTGCLCS